MLCFSQSLTGLVHQAQKPLESPFPRDWLCPACYCFSIPVSETPLESPHMHFLPLLHGKDSDLLLVESLDYHH